MGSLKLYIDGYQVDIEDADANDYLDRLWVYGVDHDSLTDVIDDATNRTAPGQYSTSGGGHDMSGYTSVKVIAAIISSTSAEFAITGMFLSCYYA